MRRDMEFILFLIMLLSIGCISILAIIATT